MTELTNRLVLKANERRAWSYITTGYDIGYIIWLESIVKSKIFSLPFSSQRLARIHQNANDKSLESPSDKLSLAIGCGVISALAAAIVIATADVTVATAFHTELPTWVNALGGTTIIGAGTLGINPFFSHKKKKFQALEDRIAEKLTTSMHVWFLAQMDYKTKISRSISKKIILEMIGKAPSINFSDETRADYLLVLNKDNGGYELTVTKKADKIKSFTKGAPNILNKASQRTLTSPSIPTKANQLRERIETRVNMLSEFTLSVETEHAVGRIISDMQAALQSYQKLYSLTLGRKGTKNLLNVLTMLDGETSRLIEQESEQIVKELVVQESYVSARQGNDLSLLVEK
jgi:hypothetical protein